MKLKYVIGTIAALVLIFAAVSTMNAAPTKTHKFKAFQDMWTVSNLGTISAVQAEEYQEGDYINVNGEFIGQVWSKYYVTYDNGVELTTTIDKKYIEYNKVLDATLINDLKKQAIVNKANELYGISLNLQDLRYNKKTPGNQ